MKIQRTLKKVLKQYLENSKDYIYFEVADKLYKVNKNNFTKFDLFYSKWISSDNYLIRKVLLETVNTILTSNLISDFIVIEENWSIPKQEIFSDNIYPSNLTIFKYLESINISININHNNNPKSNEIETSICLINNNISFNILQGSKLSRMTIDYILLKLLFKLKYITPNETHQLFKINISEYTEELVEEKKFINSYYSEDSNLIQKFRIIGKRNIEYVSNIILIPQHVMKEIFNA